MIYFVKHNMAQLREIQTATLQVVFDTPWGPNKDVNTIPNVVNCEEKNTTNLLRTKYMVLDDFFRLKINKVWTIIYIYSLWLWYDVPP